VEEIFSSGRDATCGRSVSARESADLANYSCSRGYVLEDV
jgi:hypothetical protein